MTRMCALPAPKKTFRHGPLEMSHHTKPPFCLVLSAAAHWACLSYPCADWQACSRAGTKGNVMFHDAIASSASLIYPCAQISGHEPRSKRYTTEREEVVLKSDWGLKSTRINTGYDSFLTFRPSAKGLTRWDWPTNQWPIGIKTSLGELASNMQTGLLSVKWWDSYSLAILNE